MKKIQIICLAALAAALFGSCHDDSGTYASQLFTNSEKSSAIKSCLTCSLDTAVAHLCTPDGFSEYKDGLYRLDFSGNRAMTDTLALHSYGYLSDSLVYHANRLAESCGSVVRSAFSDAISGLTLYDYDALINGGGTAVTDYFAERETPALREALKSQVSIRMSLFQVDDFWSEMVSQYYGITHQTVSFDVQGYIIDKMTDGILEEMRCEEVLIRTDSTHRMHADSIVGRIFTK